MMTNHIKIAIGLFAILALAGCSIGQRTNPTTYDTSPVNAVTADSPEEGDDVEEEAGFTLQSETDAADREIASAKSIFDQCKQSAALFVKTTPQDCDSQEMERAVTNLQDIEKTASRYVEIALAYSLERDREAALDVADELTPMALDGYMEAVTAYRSQQCYDRAKFYLQEIVRIYSGDSFAQWRNDAIKQIEEITAIEQDKAKAEKVNIKKPARKMKKS